MMPPNPQFPERSYAIATVLWLVAFAAIDAGASAIIGMPDSVHFIIGTVNGVGAAVWVAGWVAARRKR